MQKLGLSAKEAKPTNVLKEQLLSKIVSYHARKNKGRYSAAFFFIVEPNTEEFLKDRSELMDFKKYLQKWIWKLRQLPHSSKIF